jgi:phage gp36-like protein
MALVELTNIERLNSFLSVLGVISFSEHDSQGNDGQIVDECCNYASAILCGRLAARYQASRLSGSVLLQEIATVIAARVLCTRRGNPIPDSLELRYQEIMERNGILDQIANGQILLFDESGNLIAGIGAQAPVVSNLQVDRRYWNEKVRVVRGTSMKADSGLERDFAADYNGVRVDG